MILGGAGLSFFSWLRTPIPTTKNPINAAHTITSRFFLICISSVEMGQPAAQKILFEWPASNMRSHFPCFNRKVRVVRTLDALETSAKCQINSCRNRVRYSRMEFLPIRPAFRPGWDSGSAAPAQRTEGSPQCRLTIQGQPALRMRAGGKHETGMFVRMDNTVTVPATTATSAAFNSNAR
jgi:hypothetical protein